MWESWYLAIAFISVNKKKVILCVFCSFLPSDKPLRVQLQILHMNLGISDTD